MPHLLYLVLYVPNPIAPLHNPPPPRQRRSNNTLPMSSSQLSRLIDLPDSDIQQVLEYASTLSKPEAAEHFKNLLGESPQAVEFISAFNSRRQDPTTTLAATVAAGSSEPQPAEVHRKPPKKKKPPLHTPAPRQVASAGPPPGRVYQKDSDDDYIAARSSTAPARAAPAKSSTPPPSKLPPSASGSLISDVLPVPSHSKPKSNPVSRTSTPVSTAKPKSAAKVSIIGGTPMQGMSSALTDLAAAIRSLEITTNPSLSSAADVAARRCNCVATRHPLQSAAPNCLNCGKVICVKEGLGNCTFCGQPLLSRAEVQAMIRELRAEVGQEKMAADRESHRRADVASTPRPFTKPRGEGDLGSAEAKALEHRDKLLGFQAQNARRTTVRDEAADFDVSSATAGTGSIWATPEDRARELKRQQKVLREMEWNARPDYEKRKQVVSIDIVKGKVVRKMMAMERPKSPDDDRDDSRAADADQGTGRSGGAFSRNPLGVGMIKPVYDAKGEGAELEGRKDGSTRWRRVQDDLDDNEAVILDGGLARRDHRLPAVGGGDEPDCG